MAYVTQGHTPVQSSYGSGWFAGLAQSYRRWRIERRTYNELSALSDRELDDLGLSRGDLSAVALRASQGV